MRISDWSSDVCSSDLLFVEQSAALIKVLKKKTAGDVADLMKLSDTLATLNVGRYAAWKQVFDQTNSRQAALAFNGDVYEGLDASILSDARLPWEPAHVAILSGLSEIGRASWWERGGWYV